MGAAQIKCALLLIFVCAMARPSLAQTDIEDLPITDVVPTPVPAKTTAPKPTAKPAAKPTPKPTPTTFASPAKAAPVVTPAAKPTAKTALEDLPVEDAPPVATTPSASVNPALQLAPKEIEKATGQVMVQPTATPDAGLHESHEQPSEEHFEAAHSEPAFPAPDGHTIGWFDLAHTFQIDFLREALYAGLLVALMCSYLGVYVVLKRIVFVGVALAELSSAGIAVGLWMGFSPIAGAMLLVLFGVTMFAVRWSPRRVPGDSTIGIVYSVAGALAILCISKSAMGETHMLKLLQGDVLTVSPQETMQMLGIFGVVALVHGLFGKEFLLVSFDRDAASTMGYKAVRWDFLLYLTIGIIISFSIRATGVLMATTMLIIPAVTALLLAQRMRQVWPLALASGVVPVVLGLHLSFLLDLPASAIIVALSFGLLLPVLAFSAGRH